MQTYYYKQIDIIGNIIALLTCDAHLESSESQVEITEEEYQSLLQEMQTAQDAEEEMDNEETSSS